MSVVSGVKASDSVRVVPVDWEGLLLALENNSPEVHSFLHLGTGAVLRIVDVTAAAEESLAKLASDPDYIRVDPVSSRDQYRWMERFITELPDGELRARLGASIDGKGAFRRFKDALVPFAEVRELWFQYRGKLLRAEAITWLSARSLAPDRPPPDAVTLPPKPEALGVAPARSVALVPGAAPTAGPAGPRTAPERLRDKLHDVADAVPAADLGAAVTFLEYLRDRRPRSVRRESRPPPEPAAADRPSGSTPSEPPKEG